MGRWRLLDTGVLSAAENVALDEAILRARAEGAAPDTVRFLQYSPPAVLIGYHQSPSQEIRLDYCEENGIELGRRITGGGAILFDEGQLGWEVIAARGAGGLPTHHAGLYPALCGAVAAGLKSLGVAAEFRPRNDIEVDGRKVSGTGGLQEGDAFLFQGTLLVDFDLEAMVKALRIPVQKLAAKELDSMRERVTWLSRELGRAVTIEETKTAVARALSDLLGAELVTGDLTDREREIIGEVLPRFRSREWLYRTDRPGRERGLFTAGIRTDGGTVRVDTDVDSRRKRIQSLVITGDFFCEPRRAVLDLEARFKDAPVDRGRIGRIVETFLGESGAGLLGVSGDDLERVIWDAVRKSSYVALGLGPGEADRVNVSGGDLMSVLDRGATRLLLPYCAKETDCERRHSRECDECGRCAVGEAYELGRELGLGPVTITSFENLEAEWRRMADEGVRAYVGSCCEPFFTKHRREFEQTPVPGVLVDLESATCYDLGQAREAHEGRFEGRTDLRLGLLAKICRLAAERRAASSVGRRQGGGRELAMGRARKRDTRLVNEVAASLGPGLAVRLRRAREESRAHHGRRVTFYLPGMVRYGNRPVRYPAVSITGRKCDLGCAHCAGRLLETMTPAETPAALVETARRLADGGALGMLVSGGSDVCGRLPWADFLGALREIKETTPLKLSVHTGLVDPETARGFAGAGVDAALFDVVGSDECLRKVFHLDGGVEAVERSLDALAGSGVELVPHVVIGLEGDGGREGRDKGEKRAVEMIAARDIGTISFVVFMPLRGTELEGAKRPELGHVAEVLAFARETMPAAVHSLGCARPRDAYGEQVEAVALMAGVNRLAVPTGGAEDAARELGLEVRRQETCCSVGLLS